MPGNVRGLCLTLLLLLSFGEPVGAQIRGEIVSTKLIWDQAAINRDTDLVRFNDRWFVVCCETSQEFSRDAALRVISSVDSDRWESVALLPGPSAKASYRYDSAIIQCPDGKLMISSMGLKTFAWFSTDGQTWSDRIQIGPDDFEYSRVAWNKEVGLMYAHGIHDGNSSTVQIVSNQEANNSAIVYEESFDFIPDDGMIVFTGDRAHCVMSRQATNPIAPDKELGRQFQTGLLGTAEPPYKLWTWKPIEAPLCVPKLLILPDQRIIAAVGLSNKKDCISLCEFDVSTGSLTEFLKIPIAVKGMVQAAYHRQIVGLAYHDGSVWVSYHATHEGKLCIFLTQVKLA